MIPLQISSKFVNFVKTEFGYSFHYSLQNIITTNAQSGEQAGTECLAKAVTDEPLQ